MQEAKPGAVTRPASALRVAARYVGSALVLGVVIGGSCYGGYHKTHAHGIADGDGVWDFFESYYYAGEAFLAHHQDVDGVRLGMSVSQVKDAVGEPMQDRPVQREDMDRVLMFLVDRERRVLTAAFKGDHLVRTNTVGLEEFMAQVKAAESK